MDISIIGLLLVVAAGIGTGTTAWPMGRIKDLHLGLFLFVSMGTALFLIPWLVVLYNLGATFSVLKEIGLKPLLISNLLSVGWGIANVLYYICVVRIGSAMTGALLSALGMSCGMLLPMLVKGSGTFQQSPDLFSKAGLLIVLGLGFMLLGGIILTFSGFAREKFFNSHRATTSGSSGSFLQGLILVIIAGILSSGLSLSFVYGQAPIVGAVQSAGGSDITANFAVWAFGVFGGGLVNLGYSGFLICSERRQEGLFSRKKELLYGIIMGVQFIFSIVFLGKGMLLLGGLGASIGLGIQQSMQVIGNQLVGFFRGEWKGVFGKPLTLLYTGLAVVLIATAILAYSNSFI